MILGIKTGPKNFAEGQKVITDLGASMCEVWFDVTKSDRYTDMLAWLAKHNVSVGLHHWGIIDAGIKTNLATQDVHIRNETIKQIKRTIDIGQSIGCAYVNAHPGAQAVETIDFADWKQTMVQDKHTPPDIAKKLFVEAAQELTQYANDRDVLFTIESITARESAINHDRFDIYDPGNTPLSSIEEATHAGAWFANDISHTGSHFLVSEDNPDTAWQGVMKFSQRMAARTCLIHMNVITPPYNGTDSHDGITDTDFEKEAFPSKQNIIDFLRLFKDRDDVFVVNEPKEDVGGNYLALQRLVVDSGSSLPGR